jgi:hypothetical protein
MNNITLTGEGILTQLGIIPSHLKHIKNHSKRIQYRAIINWLTKYQPPQKSDALQLIQGYIETLHHLCQIQQWQGIHILLNVSIAINPQTTTLSMPFYEYFFFKELSKNLLSA